MFFYCTDLPERQSVEEDESSNARKVDDGHQDDNGISGDSDDQSDDDAASKKPKDTGKRIMGKDKRKGRKNGKANHVNDNDGDVGNYRWPNFENPDDCGDYIPHKKQKKLTDYFSNQNGGLPSISLKVPGTPSIASTSHKRGTFQEPVTSRDEPSTSKPNDKSVTNSRDEINRSKHDDVGLSDIDDDMESIGSSDDESGSIQAEWDLVNQLHNRRFQAAEYVYNLHFNQEVRGSIADILGTIHEMLEKFLDDVKSNKNMQESDFIRLVIISPELREPIAIPWVLVRDLDVDAILEFIQKVIQSNDNFYLHKGVTFVVKHVRNPNGGGHSRKDPLDNDDFVMFKRGLVSVSKKDDDLCFGKAIVKALYHKNGPLHHEKANSIRCERGILMLLTKELYAKAGVKEGKVSSEEYCKFQEVLSKGRHIN